MPPADHQRAEGLRAQPAARRTAARSALREILGRYLGEDPAAIALARGDNGKPRLAQAIEALCFNLSHSGPLALVAVTRGREVGVDLEQMRTRRDLVALAQRALKEEAAADIREAKPEQRAELFYARWTEHEARLKCLGTGIAAATERHEPVAVRKLEVAPGYAAAVAVAGEEMPPCRCYLLG